MENRQREVWLRGPLEDMPPLLQPVAHALLQAREEVEAMMSGFPEIYLWVKPSGLASPAFHLQHMKGVLDRLFTYARGESLSSDQLSYLSLEGKESDHAPGLDALLTAFSSQVDKAVLQLRQTNEAELTSFRAVGRARLPSTMIGLMVHSAEHIMRHTGQLLVTSALLRR